jgi:hypothetical protein
VVPSRLDLKAQARSTTEPVRLPAGPTGSGHNDNAAFRRR